MTIDNQPIARLLWRTDIGNQELLIGQDDIVTIGRGDMNTIVIDSPRVSRNHARIEWGGDSFIVLDLRSSNGTYVNGKRLEYLPYRLNNGDYIFLERFPIHFEIIQQVQTEQDVSTLPTVPLGGRSPDLSRHKLIITTGSDSGREIVIDKDVIVIGRESQNASWDVRLRDRAVSRPHARIEQKAGNCILFDIGSANGTTVNDELVIAPVVLRNGDIIGLGTCKVVFRTK